MELSSLDARAAVIGWPVFRDGHVRRLICIWLERQIARLGKELETTEPDRLKNLQGQIAALRIARTFLDQNNVETLISEMKLK